MSVAAVNRLHSDCLSCFATKQLKNVPAGVDEPTRTAYMKRVLQLLADANPSSNAPILAHDIDAVREEFFGIRETYDKERVHFNSLMIDLTQTLEARVREATDPLAYALRLAMMGNYIDFTIIENVNDAGLLGHLDRAGEIELDAARVEEFRSDLAGASTLTLLTDNCGEIVCDKILLRQIQREYSDLKLRVVVKGEPVVNDATREDAHQVGMDEVAEVLDHGCNYPGNPLEKISSAARDAIEHSDVVISKGQANFESLFECGLPVWYLFMVKCELFSTRFDVDLYQGVMVRDSEL